MINIKYPHGQMNIEPSVFFPTSAARCKKLVKVINMDWEHSEDIIKDIIISLENLIGYYETAKTANAKEYADNLQSYADLTYQIDSGKCPNGVPIKKNDIKSMLKDRKQHYLVTKDNLKEFNRCCKNIEKLKKNLEFFKVMT